MIIFRYFNSLFNFDNKINDYDNDNIKQDHLRSKELEKKLALLVKNLENIDTDDLKFVNIVKIDHVTKEDLFISYRLDFNGRDKMNKFKKKYKNLLL